MRRFWKVAVRPILKAVEPRVLVEIGSDEGGQTRVLADYCRDHERRLHVIDPKPAYSVEDWRRLYGDRVQFHLGLSLDVLPELEPADVVLVDGDHNWYTVFHELTELERTAETSGRTFPLVLLHDIGWPYGRRDLYYAPETIPEEHRQPCARGGILPDQEDPVEGGGINPHHVHALFEGGRRNGVLTAVEDFLAQTRFDLSFHSLPGIHGLGTLVPRELEEDCPPLREILKDWQLTPGVSQYLELLEKLRLEKEIGFQDKRRDAHRHAERAAELKHALTEERELRNKEIRKHQAEQKALEEARREIASSRQETVELVRELREMLEASRKESRETSTTLGSFLVEHFESSSQEMHSMVTDVLEHTHRVSQSVLELRAGLESTADVPKELTDLQSQLASLSERLRKMEFRRTSPTQEVVGLRVELAQLREAKREAEEAYDRRTNKWREAMEAYDRRTRKYQALETQLNELYASRAWTVVRALRFLRAAVDPRRWPELAGKVRRHWKARRRSGGTPLSVSSSGKPAERVVPGPGISVDVVVCVHDALEDVRRCLESVIEKTDRPFRLIVVNDGSGPETTSYLRGLRDQVDDLLLLESDEATGYTRAANRGLEASTADYVVLLNSDTMVPRGWLTPLLECGESDESIGILGPLSNAASWQSVPERFDGQGDWSVNPLPEEISVDQMAQRVAAVSERRFPRVGFINGFCFVIKRKVIETLGGFDEESFPRGYGEENDYCLRASAAGFDLAIADHAYVYHAKSKSYSHARRRELARRGRDALHVKHEATEIARRVEHLKNEPVLARLRDRLREALQSPFPLAQQDLEALRVLFVLPVKGGGGGVHSIVQEATGMQSMGVVARIAVPAQALPRHRETYPKLPGQIFMGFETDDELVRKAGDFDVAIATIFTSVKLVERIVETHSEILPAYYIQDYEPWICKGDRDLEREARESYTRIPDIVAFAKTDWICEQVSKEHDVQVSRVLASLDTSVYYPAFRVNGKPARIRIAAMVRPKTPRRGATMTMDVLRTIWREYGDRVEIATFGCRSNDPRYLELPRDFPHHHHGILLREEVGDVLRSSDVFLDASVYQAFGRTALEAMACGCAVIVPQHGGTSEYARHEENALVVDTRSRDAILKALRHLLDKPSLVRELAREGVTTALRYTIPAAAASELSVLREALSHRRRAVGA